jgi:hypothetical protein
MVEGDRERSEAVEGAAIARDNFAPKNDIRLLVLQQAAP